MLDLETIAPLLWYLVMGVSILFYVVLDGFDLGVGILHLFARTDEERRICLNAIGPVWDGNEVWLVIVGGAMFAGFPDAYATIFSGFYDLCFLLLFGLIFRAISMEVRSKQASRAWRAFWDIVFSAASTLIAFGVGLTLGNFMEGVPLNDQQHFHATLELLFRPYNILTGLFTCSLFALHGAIFLGMKTEGALQNRVRGWASRASWILLIFFGISTAATWANHPHMVVRFKEYPLLLTLGFLAGGSLLLIPRYTKQGRFGSAFLCSSLGTALLFLVAAIGIYPNILRSTIDPKYSLTFTSASASPLTLKILLLIVVIGLPLVFSYGFIAYKVFHGKVRLDHSSY